jgi:hypothetical protein
MIALPVSRWKRAVRVKVAVFAALASASTFAPLTRSSVSVGQLTYVAPSPALPSGV